METSPSPGSSWYRLELAHFWEDTVARGLGLCPCPSHSSPRTGAVGCSGLGSSESKVLVAGKGSVLVGLLP